VASRERVSADYTVLEFRIAHEWEAEHRLAALALGRNARAFVGFLSEYIIPLLMRFIKILSTPKRAARVITKILTDGSGQTGVYYDEGGQPMLGSALMRDPKFQDHVVTETRTLLATVTA
jgi:hypothetical protein